MTHFFALVKSINTNVFLGCPEKSHNAELYNSVFVINRKGNLIGRQRKVSNISDNWSNTGTVIEPIEVESVNVGVMICADAYTKNVANTLFTKIAPSAWGPGLHGPNGEWEQRSIDTGLPIFVCNRTGEDETVTFWEAESHY